MAEEITRQKLGATMETCEMAMQPEVRLQSVGPIGWIEPEWISAIRMLRVRVDVWRFVQKRFVMLEVRCCVAQFTGMPLMPSSRLIDKEGVVDACRLASCEASAL